MSAFLSRRTFLKNIGVAGAVVRIGLPPLAAMFNSSGTAYANGKTLPTRFVLWFNGNGIPEKYWIPRETGAEFEITPCLRPLAPFRNDIPVSEGVSRPADGVPKPGNSHYPSMSALVSGQPFTGRGAGGRSIDQLIARKIGEETRFRSLQVGVSQESFGESIQRNLSWSGRDRALPPEMIPHKLFDRIFGARDEGWVKRKRSILDAVREDAVSLKAVLGKQDQ